MSKEVKRYWKADVEDGGLYVASEDFDALRSLADDQAAAVTALNKHAEALTAERDALLAERDRLREALEQIENANWSSSETATDFAISQAKGLLIGKMKRIASAALQGSQP